jgi:hypothetical protein
VPSPEFIAQRIKELHPESDERDILPDSMDDPSFAECLQLNTDQVKYKCWQHWMDLFLFDRKDPNYDPTLTPPTVLHKAFTAFFNKILQRRTTGEGRELLVTASLIIISKPD